MIKDKEIADVTDVDAGKEMTIIAHLGELRNAILVSALAVLGTTIFCFYYNTYLIDFLTYPLTNNIKNVQLIFVSPGEAFMSTLRMALLTGLLLALPVILNRLYWFIAPGLSKNEKKISLPLLMMAYFLFAGGLSFAYMLVLPFGVKFLVEFAPGNIAPMISIGKYISFASTVIFGTGLVFELPLVLLLLALVNIVNVKMLKTNRRYAFLIAFVIGAIITPSVDIMTQSILAGALYILYESSIVMIRFLEYRRNKKVLSEI